MRKKNKFVFSSAINLFIVSFVGFVLLIYIEDIYIFRQLEKNNEILPIIYVGRVLIALSFSIFTALLGFIYIYQFTNKLRGIEKKILSSNSDSGLNTYEIAEDFEELSSLSKTIYFTLKDKGENINKIINNDWIDQLKEIKNVILPNIFDIKLNQVKNIDISIIPNKSRDSSSDFFDFMEVKNGFIVCMLGSPKDDIYSTIIKYKIKTLFEIYAKVSNQLDENVFHEIFSEVNKIKNIKINFTMIYISKDSGRVIYHVYQKNPIIFIQKDKIHLLYNVDAYEFLSSDGTTNPLGLEILENEYLILISDRIRKLNEFSDLDFFNTIKEQNFINHSNNSKEILLAIIKKMEEWQNKYNKTDSIYENLLCSVIRKK